MTDATLDLAAYMSMTDEQVQADTAARNAAAFAAACSDTNTREELVQALLGPADMTDCKEWNITPAQWRASIAAALVAKCAD